MNRIIFIFLIFIVCLLPSYSGPIFDHLFIQFFQGKAGNCASIAVIKAAMDTYGTKVVTLSEKADGSILVKQRDGFVAELTPEEQALAVKHSYLEGVSTRELVYAIILYASMADRVVVENNLPSYVEGLNRLNGPTNPVVAAHWLGLQHRIKSIPVDRLYSNNVDCAVLWSEKHSVYIDKVEGKYYIDLYGDPFPWNGTDGNGNKILYGFKFQ
jgi:hypothetical protein